jgi:hypothetical protein
MDMIQSMRRPVTPPPQPAPRTALDVEAFADLDDAIAHLRAALADGGPARGPRQRLRRAILPTYSAVSPVFYFTKLKRLAEDKRFELLRVSPTRFPILLMSVRR